MSLFAAIVVSDWARTNRRRRERSDVMSTCEIMLVCALVGVPLLCVAIAIWFVNRNRISS
jgi:hypothetical protein